MNLTKAYNYISFSTVVFPFVFIGKYVLSKNINYLLALGGTIFTNLLTEYLKYNIFKNNTRPIEARNCNLMNNDGSQGGKPGMPSSHAAITTYFVFTYLYLNYKEQKGIDYISIIILLTYLYLVALSRYKKHCHSIQQLLAGFSLGFSIFLIQVYLIFR